MFRRLAERWLRIPPAPEPPPGDEACAQVFRASPNYLNYLRVLWAIRSGFGLLAPLFAFAMILGAANPALVDSGPLPWLLPALAALILAGVVIRSVVRLALVQLDFEKRWYLVTDRSLRIREGVTTVREITFTFANIQNLSVTQGPIQRLLGIADLKVETAGGGGLATKQPQQPGPNLHTAYFRGIDQAGAVKELIATRMRSHRDSGLGDQDDPGTAAAAAPGTVDALHAVLDEARALRAALEARR